MQRTLILFLFLCTALDIYAQDSNGILVSEKFENYTLEDGLPSNETYFITQDKLGYLWIATDNGIVKYNGSSFKVFTTADGATDDVVYRFFRKDTIDLWCATGNNKLFKINTLTDQIDAYSYNDRIQSELSKRTTNITSAFDEQGSLHLGYAMGPSLSINPQGITTKSLEVSESHHSINVHEFYAVPSFKYSPEIKSLKINYIDTSEDHSPKIDCSTTLDISILRRPLRSKKIKDKLVFSINNEIILFDKNVKDKIELSSWVTFIDAIDNEVWVGLYNGGVLRFRIENNRLIKEQQLLHPYSITSVYKDFQNNYWFSSLKKGIFHFQNIASKEYRFKNEILIKDILQTKNHLIVENENRSLFFFNKKENKIKVGNIHFDQTIYLKSYDSIKNIVTIEDANHKYHIREETGQLYKKSKNNFLNLKKIKINDSVNYVADNNNSYLIVSDRTPEKIIAKKRIYDSEIVENKIFIASNPNVYELEYPLKNIERLNSIPSKKFTDLLKVSDKDLLLYNKKVVQHYDLSTKKSYPLQLDNEVDYIYKIKHVNDVFYLLTSSGIYEIITDVKPFIVSKSSNKIAYNIEWSNGIFYLFSETSFLTIPGMNFFQENINSGLLNVHITQVKTKEQQFSPIYGKYPSYQFSHDENSIDISFEDINFSSVLDHYSGFLIHENDTTQYNAGTNNSVLLDNLKSGNYEFYIYTKVKKSPSIYFSIQTPIWSRGWFQILMACIFATLLIVAYFGIVSYHRKKLIAKNEINILKSKSLNAQINPHFVFNIMNTIQASIAKGDIRNSNIFLSKFSKFIRKVLNINSRNFISLHDELMLIEEYLDLENIKNENKTSISKELNIVHKSNEIIIPPLLIQPLIENCLKHGEYSKNPTIFLRITQNKKWLEVQVKNATKERNFSFGKGMDLVHQRIKAFNKKNTLTASLEHETFTAKLTINLDL